MKYTLFAYLLVSVMLHAQSVVNVMNYGARGTNAVDDSAAIAAAAKTACSAAPTTLYFPPAQVAYKVSSGVTLCSQLRVSADHAKVNYTGSGAMFTIPLSELVEVSGFLAYGTNEANTNFISITGGGNTIHIHDNLIKQFGDAATGSGGAISVSADTASLSIDHNEIDGYGTGVLINAPTDTLDIADNHISGGGSRCIDINNGSGAATVRVEHNNLTCLNGAVRVQGSGISTLVTNNEYEAIETVGNASSAPFEFLAPLVHAENNIAGIGSYATYAYYVSDDSFDSTFVHNRCSMTATSGRYCFHTATNTNGTYENNISYSSGGANLYDNPNQPGIFQWPIKQ